MLCVLLQIMEFLELRQLIIVLALIMSLCSLWDTLRILLSRGLAHNGTIIAVIPLALTRDFFEVKCKSRFSKAWGADECKCLQNASSSFNFFIHMANIFKFFLEKIPDINA